MAHERNGVVHQSIQRRARLSKSDTGLSNYLLRPALVDKVHGAAPDEPQLQGLPPGHIMGVLQPLANGRYVHADLLAGAGHKVQGGNGGSFSELWALLLLRSSSLPGLLPGVEHGGERDTAQLGPGERRGFSSGDTPAYHGNIFADPKRIRGGSALGHPPTARAWAAPDGVAVAAGPLTPVALHPGLVLPDGGRRSLRT